MKYIAIAIKGLEDIAIKEIKEIIKAEAKLITPGRLQFETKNIDKLIKKSQSIVKIYELYGKKGLENREPPEANQPIHNTIGYHIRKGKHDVTDYDWEQYLAFAKLHLLVGR